MTSNLGQARTNRNRKGPRSSDVVYVNTKKDTRTQYDHLCGTSLSSKHHPDLFVVATETQTETGVLLEVQICMVDGENDTPTPGTPSETIYEHAYDVQGYWYCDSRIYIGSVTSLDI